MRIDVFTLFPEMVEAGVTTGVIGRGISAGHLDVRTHDPRQTTSDVHRTVDDSPFGGGAGMVMKAEPILASIEQADPPRPVFYLSPAGRRFDQQFAEELAATDGFSMLCGRYEGVDQRALDHGVDSAISLGDFVLAGGEVAAIAVIEAVGRLVPGVLGNDDSVTDESFASGLLEYPQYTRPAEFNGWEVPEILRSGDHAKVARWRLAQSLHTTIALRPDLIEARGGLTAEEANLLSEFPAV